MIQTDELDEQILKVLEEDGRCSNREVGRRVGVSEGTVRQRLKKLIDAQAIRIGVVADPHRLGLTFSALVWAAVAPRELAAALAAFAQIPEISHVSALAGRYNAFLVLSSRDQAAMLLLVNRIRAVRGVDEIAVRAIVSTIKQKIRIATIRRTAGGETAAPTAKKRVTRQRL